MKLTLVSSIFLILCAAASESVSRKAKSRKTTHNKVKHVVSSLTNTEAIHAQAVSLIKDLINSFDKVLEDQVVAKDEFTNRHSAQYQLERALYFLNTVAKYVPSNNENEVSKLKTLKNSITEKTLSLDDIATEDSGRKKKKRTGKSEDSVDFTIYCPYKVKAIKEIIATLKVINFSELPFERVRKLSKLLLNFAKYLNYEDGDHLNEFRRTFRAFRKRETQLKVVSSTIDFKNIEQVYASYSRKLLEIIQKTLPAQKGTHSQRLSVGIQLLASAATQFAAASPNANEIQQQIDDVTKMERGTMQLYSVWKDINGIHESNDYSSSELLDSLSLLQIFPY